MNRAFLLPIAPLALAVLLAGCSKSPRAPDAGRPDAALEDADAGADAGAVPPQRCAIPLERYLVPGPGFTSAKQVAGQADLVGGPNAYGKIGDWSLANDKIKVIVQGHDRHIGPNPYGGTILDADLVRDGPGQDEFGEVGLFYNLARTVDPDFFEIISAGGDGQPAIVAGSGRDTAQNYLRIKNIFNVSSIDLDQALPLRITNYFVLNPGEQRVRYVTGFCNEGGTDVVTIAGDLIDPGWSVELFNGEACTGGFGYGGMCEGIDRMSWFGYQGHAVAYGYAPYRPDAPYQPSLTNATMTVSGVTGTLIGADGLSGVSDWLNPNLTSRQGELRIPAGGSAAFARDFVVGHDIGEVASLIADWRGALTSTNTGAFEGNVTRGGAPLAGARVSLQQDGAVAAVFVTDAAGHYQGRLAVGAYLASAWALGSPASPDASAPAPVLQVSRDGVARADFTLDSPRSLTVTVHDAQTGAGLPAKVTVVCATGVCPATWSSLARFTDVVRDVIPDNVQLIDFVPVAGSATFLLPQGEYNVLVSRGMEWSIFPADYPTSPGAYVDLRASDGAVDAVLAHVVDTSGWAGVDFHVHGVYSPDSYVEPDQRVASYAAEGVDVLVSTDHDFVTDYMPIIKALGADELLTTIAGEEVSPLDYGHTIVYPLVPDDSDTVSHGAIDWGNGHGPTLTTAQIFAQARAKGATSVHINHPRGWPLGVLSQLLADTDTLATHADPSIYGMAAQPGATASDQKLLSNDFDAYEVLNATVDYLDVYQAHPCFNDWFTLISRGMKVAGVGNSDSHMRFATAGGYWRTWVQVADDTPKNVTVADVSGAVNAGRAVTGDGPFVRIKAVRVAADGTPSSAEAGIGDCLSASSDDVLVTVDIEAPQFMDVSKVELYMHQSGDDASCPVDPQSPEAQTARVACNGESNSNWPQSGIAATQSFTLGASDLETAFTVANTDWKRWHKVVTFRLPAPTTDNWFVAMVYGSQPLFPLVYPGSLSSGGAKPAYPFTLTNPIFVDADGNGYDHPPFHPRQHHFHQPDKRAAPQPRAPLPRQELLRRAHLILRG